MKGLDQMTSSLVCSDKPMSVEELGTLARAFQRQKRLATVNAWVQEGYIKIRQALVDGFYVVEGGKDDPVSHELMDTFPTDETVARIGLAIECGAYRRHGTGLYYTQTGYGPVGYRGNSIPDEWCEIKEKVYNMIATETRKLSGAKGLR